MLINAINAVSIKTMEKNFYYNVIACQMDAGANKKLAVELIIF